MVDREPWSVGKLDHGQTPRLHHSQPWSTMVDNEKPWYRGQTVAGVRQTEIPLVDSQLAVHRVPSRALK